MVCVTATYRFLKYGYSLYPSALSRSSLPFWYIPERETLPEREKETFFWCLSGLKLTNQLKQNE